MTKHEAIEKLTRIVSRIPRLETQERFSEDFKKWQHDAHALLKHAFPDEKQYIRDFDMISYSLIAYSTLTPDSAFDEAFRSGLASARAMLQSRIDEVAEFWPETPIKLRARADHAANSQLVFVIHGRQCLADFHDFLRALGLKPLEWSQARSKVGRPNPYTWEIVDTALRSAGAIVALLTPDDEARLRRHLWSAHENAIEKEYLSQPRQNVLFEAGVAYGRSHQRTILVRIGQQRPMSDLGGHHIIQLDDSAKSRQEVADALRTAGCPVDLSGTDWYRAGVFSLPDPPEAPRKEIDAIKNQAPRLLLYKTRLKGFSDLLGAAPVVTDLHEFFDEYPEYLSPANATFLEKYPMDFQDEVYFDAANAMNRWSIDELKSDAEFLQTEPSTTA